MKLPVRFFIVILLSFIIISAAVHPAAADPAKSEQKITFNFVDVEIPTVIKFISEITGRNF
ncbi:MAG: hypothetical protein HY758_09410, partial [Nitrospirae bacterium]|nr:hypothetical protein [Nitrospirota bacterium]